MTARKDRPLDLAKVAKAVQEAQFTLLSTEITATGRVIDGRDTRFAFKIKGSGERFWLVNNEQIRKLTSIRRLRRREVTITGKLVESQKTSPGLAVETYQVSNAH